MKKSELLIAAILVPVDALMLVLSGIAVYHLRFNNAWIVGLRPVLSTIDSATYFRGILLVALVGIIVFAFGGLYAIRVTRSLREEAVRIAYACATLLVLVILFLFFSRQIFLSRFLILGFLIISTVLVLFGRLCIRSVERQLFRRGFMAHRVVVIGSGETTKALTREFAWHPELGFRVAANINQSDLRIGERLEELNKKDLIDEVLVAEQPHDARVWEAIFAFVDAHQRILKYAADVTQRRQTRRDMTVIGTIPVVEFKRTRLEGWGSMAKRFFDIVGAGVLLIIAAPVMIVAALCIKLDSRGPVFWSALDNAQPVERIGQEGKRFRYLKFRTMRPQTHALRYGALQIKNTRADGPLVKVKNDPRVTRVGRFLRRYSIDELPELFLVLMGSMSLVGPRPHFPEEVAHYHATQRRVLTVKPGMSGLSQISGRSDLPFEEEVRLDMYYIENWSILLDLWILLKTPFIVFKGKAV